MKVTVIVDIMFTKVDFNNNSLLQEKVHDKMHEKMGVPVEGAFFSRAYKSGYWDGIQDFYNFKEDKFHTGLLPQFLEGLRELQTQNPDLIYEVIDNRPEPLMDVSEMDEEIVLGNGDGDPITLRDYQYEAVKQIIDERVGIVNIATNGG